MNWVLRLELLDVCQAFTEITLALSHATSIVQQWYNNYLSTLAAWLPRTTTLHFGKKSKYKTRLIAWGVLCSKNACFFACIHTSTAIASVTWKPRTDRDLYRRKWKSAFYSEPIAPHSIWLTCCVLTLITTFFIYLLLCVGLDIVGLIN